MGALAAIAIAAQATTTAPPSAAPSSAPSAAAASTAPVSRGSTTFFELEAGAGYATNPSLTTANQGAAFGRVSGRAVHTRVSDRTTTVISGFAQGQVYSNGQSSQKTFNLSASHDARVNEKLRVFGDALLSYDEGGLYDTRVFAAPDVPLLPGEILPPVVTTPGGDFFSVTSKTYRAAGHIGAQMSISERDYLSATTGLDHTVVKNSGFDNRYTTIPVSVSWDRQLSTRTTIGARISAAFTDYSGPTTSRSVTPQLTFQTALTERLSLNGAVGVSFTRVDDGTSVRNTTGPSASVGLCSRGDRDNLCARASIDQQTATAIGPAKSVYVGVDYSRRLDADQTISFSLSGSRYTSPTSVAIGPVSWRSTYYRAAADYSRRIGDRLFAGASLAARRLSQPGPDPKTDVSGSLFIRYRLGDLL